MIDFVKKMVCKYQKILKYICCSLVTALFEMALGWFILQLLPEEIVIVNTIAIIAGAVLHYFLTLLFVFRKKNNFKSFLVYAISFVLGILLQNAIIWLFYDMLLSDFIEIIRYIVSKGLSLVIPFAALYYIRSILNEKIK